jgi:hypothetical protein
MPTLRCVAEFVDGGDVMIGDVSDPSFEINGSVVNQQVAMRVSSHRRFVEDADSNAHNPTLHRVVLATRGRSMVLYTSLVELLSAAECAAEGTQAILPQWARCSPLPKVSIHSVGLGSITGMLASATSFSAQTRRKRRGLFLISTCLPSVKRQSKPPVLTTMTRLLRR